MQTLGVVNSIAYICGLEQYDQSEVQLSKFLTNKVLTACQTYCK
ncbi:hypothetical protein [Acetivibrio sp. MSJd-27]|nr:hypothetical protein [Acetivibrio sp. MSJd-27]